MKGIKESGAGVPLAVEEECKLAVRFAILAADEIFVPASSYFESPLCRRVINSFSSLFEFGVIWLIGGGASTTEFVLTKIDQYPRSDYHRSCYENVVHADLPPFYTRLGSATQDIITTWAAIVETDIISRLGDELSKYSKVRNLERRWSKIPELLENRAFVVDHVAPLLFSKEIPLPIRNQLHYIINEAYFASYTKELKAGVVKDLIYLGAPHPIPSYGIDLPYKVLKETARKTNFLQSISQSEIPKLSSMKNTPQWHTVLTKALKRSVQDDTSKIYAIPMELSGTMNTISPADIEVSGDPDPRTMCQFGIVTALPKEFAAVCAMLDDIKDYAIPDDPNDYAIGTAPSCDKGQKHIIVVTLLKGWGNNLASATVTNFIRSFLNVQDILMVGIACGIPNPAKPDKHVRLGDVVVSNKEGVIQYDNVKLAQGVISVRDSSSSPSALMLGKVNVLEAKRLQGQRPWEAYIERGKSLEGFVRPGPETDELCSTEEPVRKIEHPADEARREGYPKIHYGRIGSATTLLKDPVFRDALRDQFNIIAVEMEGSGIADGTWIHSRNYMLVRGICDYGDMSKTDLWQGYASVVAAAYARALLETIPANQQRYDAIAAPAPAQNIAAPFDESDCRQLAELLNKSGRANNPSARQALCIEIGISGHDLSFIDSSATRDFTLQLVNHLYQTDNIPSLSKLCNALATQLHGQPGQQLIAIKKKLEPQQ
jgi:nucleoside phosphorylase